MLPSHCAKIKCRKIGTNDHRHAAFLCKQQTGVDMFRMYTKKQLIQPHSFVKN
jgi:hypothetical protein